MAAVHYLPGAEVPAMPDRPSLNLTANELVEASGGYVRPADQLRALHERGFVRAWRRREGSGPVVLERAHYEAVTRGQYAQQPAANEPEARQPVQPNRAAFRAKYGKRGK